VQRLLHIYRTEYPFQLGRAHDWRRSERKGRKYAILATEELLLLDPSCTDSLPREYRSHFPIAERYAYLNHASVSPLSIEVRDAMSQMLTGVASHADRKFHEWEESTAWARAAAARLVNAKPHEIAFLRNTSEGLSVIANGVTWRRGDNIVSVEVEFPANIYPWLRVQQQANVELRLQPAHDGWVDIDELLSLIDERTRLVSVSWVEFGTGQRLDIRRIGRFCRERGILFVVDAVQGLGALQLDVAHDLVDAFAAGGHKFLLGPKGVALLFVSDRVLDCVRPTVIGWTAVKNYRDYLIHDLDFREGAARFEGGTLNEAGICGLGHSIDLMLRAGIERIEQHLLGLNDYLCQGLEARGYIANNGNARAERSAIVVCHHHEHRAEDLLGSLEGRDIIISARLGKLRIAPHFYNSRDDLDRLLEALPS
jgi:selenocysteine lyase/cysteine desulfurase